MQANSIAMGCERTMLCFVAGEMMRLISIFLLQSSEVWKLVIDSQGTWCSAGCEHIDHFQHVEAGTSVNANTTWSIVQWVQVWLRQN
jgi:hypothetical protein